VKKLVRRGVIKFGGQMKWSGLRSEQLITGGGIITMWKKDCFEMKRYRNENFFSIIEGVWKIGTPIEITVVNVYCGGILREKEVCGMR